MNPAPPPPPELKAKVVLCGEAATGKSSLASRFARGTFAPFSESTIGAAYLSHAVQMDGTVVRFDIWDTAGTERFRSVAPMYYRGASAAVVVFDVTSRASLEGAREWVEELRREGPAGMVVVVAGNKCDLGTKREVAEDEAREWADAEGIVVVETSAKTGKGVEELFGLVARKLIDKARSSGATAAAAAPSINLAAAVDAASGGDAKTTSAASSTETCGC